MNINITTTSESCFRVKLKERELRQDLKLFGVLEFEMKFDLGQNQIILKLKYAKTTNFMSFDNSMIIASALVPSSFDLCVEKSCWWKIVRLSALLVRLLHSMIIVLPLVPFSFDL